MELLRWKAKMSILWIIQAVAFASVIFLGLLGSKVIQVMEPPFTERLRWLVTIFFFIPCIMAWLSVILRGAVIRWLSLVFGILFAYIKLRTSLGSLSQGEMSALLFNEVWGFLAALLIIWHAWKQPKQEA
jgi:hypothetical protein